jgi:DNA-binding response OmpR family regulator
METPGHTVLQIGLLEIRPDEYVAYCDGRRLALTARELALLTALARRSDRIVSRAELYAAVWGGTLRTGDRSVDVYVRKLRAKLARARPEANFIQTHFGFGYCLSSDSSHLFHNTATSR